MPTQIDQKVAAELHKRQIEAIVKTEGIVRQLDQLFQETFDRWLIVNSAQTEPSLKIHASELMWDSVFDKAQILVYRQFERLIYWAHKELVAAYARSIPRAWFRRVSGKVAAISMEEIGEDWVFEEKRPRELKSERTLVPAGPQVLQADDYQSPISSRKRRMSDAKWAETLEKLVFPPPSETKVTQMLFAPSKVDGLTWKNRIGRLSGKVLDLERLANAFIVGYANAENLQELKQRALPIVQGIQSSAKRIVRTEGLRLAEQLQRESWDGLGDMLDGVQILAVLDQNTRPHHAARNGTIYYRAPDAGQLGLDKLPMLPDEPNCRCWSAPVLKPPRELRDDPAVAAAFANAQGAGIPDPAGYDEWFRTADVDRRKMAVGSARYNTVVNLLQGFRDAEWTDFIDQDGKLLPIETIKAESPLDRVARKQRLQIVIDRRKGLLIEIAKRGFVLPPGIGPAVPPLAPTPLPDLPPVIPQVQPPTPSNEPPVAKTTKEAAKIVRDFDLADKADFSGMDVAIASQMIRSIHETLQLFPDLRKNLQFIGTIQARNKLIIEQALEELIRAAKAGGHEIAEKDLDYFRKRARRRVSRVGSSTYAESMKRTADKGVAGIAFNKSMVKSQAKLEQLLERDVSVGYHPPGCTTAKSVVDHELAHQIDDLIGLAERTSIKDPVFRAIVQSWSTDEISKGVSRYATKNCKELIAEAWAEFKNSPTPRDKAKLIGDYIQSKSRKGNQ